MVGDAWIKAGISRIEVRIHGEASGASRSPRRPLSDLIRDRVAFASIFGPAPRYLEGLALMGLALFALLYRRSSVPGAKSR